MPKKGFGKSYSLKGKTEIKQVFAKGRFFRSGFLKIKWVSVEEPRGKVVISISKRAGNSPTRNRLKRLVRESLRLNQALANRPINLAVYITEPLKAKPQLADVQVHLDRFFAELS